MEDISKLWGDHLPLMGKRFDWELEKIEIFFHRGDKKTWIIGSHHQEQHSQWKALSATYTKITPRKKMMGLNISFLNLWIMKHTKIVKNDITPSQKIMVARIALLECKMKNTWTPQNKHVLSTIFILEYSLTDLDSERNLEEQLKNEKNPWRSTM